MQWNEIAANIDSYFTNIFVLYVSHVYKAFVKTAIK